MNADRQGAGFRPSLSARAFMIACDRVDASRPFIDPYTVSYVERLRARDPLRIAHILGRAYAIVPSPFGPVPDFNQQELEFIRAYDELERNLAP